MKYTSADVRKLWAQRQAIEAEQIASTSLPLYGLPESFDGICMLGDGEVATSRTRTRRGVTTEQVSEYWGLAHGRGHSLSGRDPWLQVITGTPPDLESLSVEALLTREARQPSENINPEEARPLTLTVDLDGKAIPFQGLQANDCWVVQASWDDVVVSLVGLRWPHEGLALVSISDATPYFQGRARLLPALEGQGGPDEEDDG